MPSRIRLNPSRRTGCATCKHRHKKCDEQKPRCRNCLRLGLECKPTELFRTSKLPHFHFDRSLSFSCHQDTASPEILVTHGNRDLLDNEDPGEGVDGDGDGDAEGLTPERTASMNCIGFSPSQGVLFTSPQPQASSMEHYLLHHYTFKMSTVLINVDGPSNPLRSILLPRAVTSPTLMNALYATSALHAFVGNHDPEFQILSLAYYNKAASTLHHLIANLGTQRDRGDFEIVLLTAVYLCKYEIISGGVSNWRSHLQGLQKLFDTKLFQENISRLAPETVTYIQSFIAYHTHIAGLTRFEKLSSSSTNCIEQKLEIRFESLDANIDPYMGVSASLISLLHVAAETIMMDSMESSNLDLMMKNVIKMYINLSLGKMECVLKLMKCCRYHRLHSDHIKASTSLELSGELDLDTLDCLGHIANAYQHALITYLHVILGTIEASTIADDLMLQCLGMRSLLALTKEEAVTACMRDIDRVPEDKSCSVGLVPLLFIVASETREKTEFETASQRLQTTLKTACLGNIAPALELLQKARQANSGNWREMLKEFGWDLIVT